MLRVGMMTECVYRFKGMKGSLKLIKDLGFECADITIQVENKHPRIVSYFNGRNYLKKCRELKQYADSIKLPLVQAHAPFPCYKDNEPNYNKRMFNKLIKSIRICGALKIKYLVIHPWNDYPDCINIKFYKKLLPYAKKENVIICCENMWRWNKLIEKAKPCSCSLSDSFLNIINGVNDKHLKACVDIGHAEMLRHMGITPRMMLEDLNKHVVCLHIHDNDGVHDNHWIPFRGVIDYKDVVKGLKNINYKNDLMLETSTPKNIDKLEDCIPLWKEQLEAIKKIRKMIIK